MEINKHAEQLKKEIKIMKTQKRDIELIISDKQNELRFVCKHTNCSKEYDDDFHIPCYFNLCLTCGVEFKI